MCLIWSRKYTLCGCVREITTTTCPPEQKYQCQGDRITFLENDYVTCKECWKRGDKRSLVPQNLAGKDEEGEHEAGQVEHLPDDGSSSTYSSTRGNSGGSSVVASSTQTSIHQTESVESGTESESEEEIWYDAVESYNDTGILSSTDEGLDSSESSEDIFLDAVEIFDTEDVASDPPSRPSTPFFDLENPAWLSMIDTYPTIDARKICQPVERVYPHYRARPGLEGSDYFQSLGDSSDDTILRVEEEEL